MSLYKIPKKDFYIFENRGTYEYALTTEMFYETLKILFIEGNITSIFDLLNRKSGKKEKITNEILRYIDKQPNTVLNNILRNMINNYMFIKSSFKNFIEDLFNWICDEKIDFNTEKKFEKSLIKVLKLYQSNSHNDEWSSFDMILLLYMLEQPLFQTPYGIDNLYDYYEEKNRDDDENPAHRPVSSSDEEDELLYGAGSDRQQNAEIHHLKNLGFYDGYDEDELYSNDPDEFLYLGDEGDEVFDNSDNENMDKDLDHDLYDDIPFVDAEQIGYVRDSNFIENEEQHHIKLKNIYIEKYFFAFNLGDDFFKYTLSLNTILDVMNKTFPLIASNVFSDINNQSIKMQRLISIFRLSKSIINVKYNTFKNNAIDDDQIEYLKFAVDEFEEHMFNLFLENDINWEAIGNLETIFNINSIEEIILSYYSSKERIEHNMISPIKNIIDVRNSIIENFKECYKLSYDSFLDDLNKYLKETKYTELKRVLIERGNEHLFNVINSSYSLYRNSNYVNDIVRILVKYQLDEFMKENIEYNDNRTDMFGEYVGFKGFYFIFDFFNINKQYTDMLNKIETNAQRINIFKNKEELSKLDKYIKEIEFAEERKFIEEKFNQKINDISKFYNKKFDYKENWDMFREHLYTYSDVINKKNYSTEIIKSTLDLIIGDNLEVKKVFSNAYFMAKEFIFNESSILDNNVELTPYITGYLKGLEQIFTLMIEYFVRHYPSAPNKIEKMTNQGYGFVLEENWHQNIGLTKLKDYIVSKMLPILVESNNLSIEIISKLKYRIERWIKDFRNSKLHLSNFFNIDGESGAKSIVFETNTILYNLVSCFIE